MRRIHPKRRIAKDNPYRIWKDENNVSYVEFTDCEGKTQTIVGDDELFNMLNEFELEDLSYLNIVDRHIEQSVLSEEQLKHRAFDMDNRFEKLIEKQEQYELLYKAVSELPEVQKTRITLYYFEDMTYEEIAELQNCTKMAVKFSVDIALEKIKKYF